MSITVARIETLPDGFPALRDAAEVEGWRMLRVLEEDWDSGSLRFDGPGEALFAAHDGGVLAGVGGLTQDPYTGEEKTARLRRLYVGAPHRGRGAGRRLVETITAAARAHGFSLLRVRAPSVAGRFYERCGFLPAPAARSATHVLPL
jgi:GNAT superfamily N-acetyltransferase